MNDNNQAGEAKEALRRIKEAEMEAAAVIAAAREEEGPRLIQAAYEESRAVKERLLEKAGNDADALKRSLIEEAETEARKIAEETDGEKSRLRSRAAPFMNQAVRETERRLAEFIKGSIV